ncbi:MAG: hypothetical protein P8H03_09850 [Emcibacteraceae bacterium]|nr:hypothetical protein [Emcibacteraceae bacterium]
MYIKQRIFTAMLMLFVIAAQTTAVQGVNVCDMDMHQMDAPQTEMGHMEHGQMKHDTMVMDKSDMSCCDTDPACAMDCSFVMASIITEQSSIDVALPLAVKIIAPSEVLATRSLTSLFRPPISA